jgi:hypothetical protein
MKLATLVIVSVLGAAGSARADEVLQPPGGAVYVSDPAAAQPQQRGMRGKQLRRAMLEAFDVNGDGRLQPRERMRAIKVLRRIEMRLGAQGGQRRAGRRFIQRYDMNGDGNVGPREMPPAQADRLRRLDRDRDGWVEPREYGRP